MSDFEQVRADLSARRRELEQARSDALLAHEAARKGERALADFARRQTRGGLEERAALERAVRQLKDEAARAAQQLDAARAQERYLLDRFEAFTDPRDGIATWSDQYPILLFPLRLETRFGAGADGRPQLWVRVYPDTCLVDGFEAALTEQEVENARVFWSDVWRAGGDEAMERAAWRDLVASHGSGRAAWIVRSYMPHNPGDRPLRDGASDVLLIVTAPAALPAEAGEYWKAVWRAGTDADARAAAHAALVAAVGEAQANEIVETYAPFNIAEEPEPPRTRADVQVKVAVLQLTPAADLQTRRTAWSSPPRIDLLPERFVLIGYQPPAAPLIEIGGLVRTPLVPGPDPNAPPDEQLKPVDDTLQIPDALAWMFDFRKALDVGMAFRIDLTAEQAQNGFDRLLVLGIRLADSAESGRARVEQLLEHHLQSRAGLAIVPQGTPTNNTEQNGSGYSFRDDADASFASGFRNAPQYSMQPDPLLRRDGQWLADLLGLRHDLVQRIPHAGGHDQLEARAMQIALWPGTAGYMMRTVLAPVFAEQTIAATRSFFTRYVSGRGPLPALRIGAQPYGIMLTTAFDRAVWHDPHNRINYFGRLHAVLQQITADWDPVSRSVPHMGQAGGDPHQRLLDVLGLHATSAEYHPLHADTIEQWFHTLTFLNYGAALDLLEFLPSAIPLALLRSFGYDGADVPDAFNRIYRSDRTPLTGPVIDDRPLSDSDPIRAYAGARNYIEWLVDAAGAGIRQLQEEQGFDGGGPPAALLYLLLRHALQIAFHDAGIRLDEETGPSPTVAARYREPAFVHVQDAASGASESSYKVLFDPNERVTGRADVRLGDHIARHVRTIDTALREQVEALERLSTTPTARLERVFAEHVDTISHRLDAWKTGLLAFQLEQMRAGKAGPRGGLFAGAYGWLEPLRPKPPTITPAELPRDVAEKVNARDAATLLRDSSNRGLIHAPSINHATTAAVLRNGYIAHGGQLAVDLSSRRVRIALEMLEGMRNGQAPGALLGYQFERYVHDHGPLRVRDLIYPLRRAFPLVADQIASTAEADGDARESIAAMNVVDGRKLIEYCEREDELVYPFGKGDLPRRPADQEAAITGALDHIRDINDAVADLVLAEGVHQAVLGNYDQSAGTLDAFAKGGYPPDPEVIRTPRSGIALTLRTALHLPPARLANPLPGIALTPMAHAEPALNAWLAARLPAADTVGCNVHFTSRASGDIESEFITQEHIGLQPIDVVLGAATGVDGELSALDDRILRYLYEHHDPRFDREIRIAYTEHVGDRVTWFELQPLLRSLRALATSSRPLQPSDLVRANDIDDDDPGTVTLLPGRVTDERDRLNDEILPALDALALHVVDPLATIDQALESFATTVGMIAEYRVPQSGFGFVYQWRAETCSGLTTRVADRARIWNERLTRFDERIAEYDAAPPATPAERFRALQSAEVLIRTALTTPTPADPAVYRSSLNGRRAAFVARLADLEDLVDNARPALAALLEDIDNALPLADFDPEPFTVDPETAEVERFRQQLANSVANLRQDVASRLTQVQARLAEHATATGDAAVRLLQDAAKVLFGDDFQLVPHIELPASAAAELANAWQHSTSGDLTRHLVDAGVDFPIDDWLHGVARVRGKMHQWENVVLLGDAMGVAAAELVPLQLPHGAAEPWLALEIPDGYAIDSDRLLYTAHFAVPFDPEVPVCGLLLDEWTEVIPATHETTGVVFHFDRPNAEPPQAWLLALPAVRNGAWSWDELVGAVNDALDSARRRALEPAHLAHTPYSWLLPATMSAYTFPEISISNPLLRNIAIHERLNMSEPS